MQQNKLVMLPCDLRILSSLSGSMDILKPSKLKEITSRVRFAKFIRLPIIVFNVVIQQPSHLFFKDLNRAFLLLKIIIQRRQRLMYQVVPKDSFALQGNRRYETFFMFY